MSCFSCFTNLIHLPRHTLDKRRNGQKIPTKGQKIVNWNKNGGFSVGLMAKGAIIACTFSICPAYVFIVDRLSSFYPALYFEGPRWQK